MVAELDLTKTERKMMDMLSDGLLHGREELLTCVPDELSSSLYVHVSNLRGKLRLGGGLDIVSVLGKGWMLVQRIQRASE